MIDFDFFNSLSKVVVIDDKYEEVRDLCKMLNEKSLDVKYISGHSCGNLDVTTDGKASEKFAGTRLVILDMNLTMGIDSHDTSRNLISILDKIISKDNGPYLLALWSKKEDELRKDFEEKLQSVENYLKPIDICSLEKSKYFSTVPKLEETVVPFIEQISTLIQAEGGAELYQDIEKKLKIILEPVEDLRSEAKLKQESKLSQESFEKLKETIKVKTFENNYFKALVQWEAITKKAITDTVTQFFDIEVDSNKSEELESLLFFLAKAKSGENTDPKDKAKILKDSYETLSSLLLDAIESNILQCVSNPIGTSIEKKKIIDEKLKAKFNSKLLLRKTPTGDHRPGTVYFEGNSEEKRKIFDSLVDKNKIESMVLKELKNKIGKEKNEELKNFSGKNKNIFIQKEAEKILEEKLEEKIKGILEKIKLILVEVSPVCDYSQQKIVYHRVLKGLYVEENDLKDIFKKNIDYVYETPLLEVDNHIIHLRAPFKYLTTLSGEELSELEKICCLRTEILSDIQAKLSSHVGKLGITSL